MATKEEAIRLIKEFTKNSPPDTWEGDPRYREYLAKCKKLLDYDLQLMNCENKGEIERIVSSIRKIIK